MLFIYIIIGLYIVTLLTKFNDRIKDTMANDFTGGPLSFFVAILAWPIFLVFCVSIFIYRWAINA